MPALASKLQLHSQVQDLTTSKYHLLHRPARFVRTFTPQSRQVSHSLITTCSTTRAPASGIMPSYSSSCLSAHNRSWLRSAQSRHWQLQRPHQQKQQQQQRWRFHSAPAADQPSPSRKDEASQSSSSGNGRQRSEDEGYCPPEVFDCKAGPGGSGVGVAGGVHSKMPPQSAGSVDSDPLVTPTAQPGVVDSNGQQQQPPHEHADARIPLVNTFHVVSYASLSGRRPSQLSSSMWQQQHLSCFEPSCSP